MFDSLEQAVWEWLSGNAEITQLLARWNGSPAVFNNNYPQDHDKGWENERQFPRIVFYCDWQSVPDRQISGSLVVYLHWQNDQALEAEAAEHLIRSALSDIFFTTKNGVFCVSWNGSEPLEFEGNEQIVHALRMAFDIIAFPDQYTYLDPDPVMGIENYVKNNDTGPLIINRDTLPDIFVPDIPVAYIRAVSVDNRGEDVYAYRFMNIQAAIHVISTDYTAIRKTLGQLQQRLMIDGEMEMPDGGQMLITDAGTNVAIEYRSGALMDGQMTLSGRFVINAFTEPDSRVNEFKIANLRFNND